MGFRVELTEAMECPEGVDGGRCFLWGEFLEGRGSFSTLAIDEEALGGEPPELVRVAESLDEVGGASEVRGRVCACLAFVDGAVDASVLFVTVGVDVGIADTAFGVVTAPILARGGVVLDDEVVPVGDPEMSVRPHFGDHGREPFVGAGYECEGVPGFVACALRLEVVHTDEVSCWGANKGALVLPIFRELAGRGESVAAGCSVVADRVDLPDVGGDGGDLVGVGNHLGG